MKIMVTGANGQLGMDCARVLKELNEVIPLGRRDLDITVLSGVEKTAQDLRPDIILNCSAYTQVDNCETEKERAWEVNVKGPENLALCARRYGGRLVHISTDYIFDGMKKIPEPYKENDKPRPLSYYGVTKLESEKAVRRATDRHMILRTAWMYGISGNNFLKTMLKLSLKNPGNEIKVVNDQHGSPTWSYRLALQISKLIETNGRGTYHVTAEGHCTWHELARYFLEKMGVPHRLIACSSEEYPTPALRPKNSILENQHLKAKGIHIMRDWQADIDQFVTDWGQEFRDKAMSER